LGNNNELLIIVFSYNRAMQLEAMLRSVRKHFSLESGRYRIKVIYHTSGHHAESYSRLRGKWTEEQGVTFSERGKGKGFLNDVLPLLFHGRNAFWFAKYPFLRKSRDDFKTLLESEIEESSAGHLMFMTDDSAFYRPTVIPSGVLEEISRHPFESSYRLYVGRNLRDAPSELSESSGILHWDYYDSRLRHHWIYPFSVDGTIYARSAFLKIARNVLYANPNSLEGFMCFTAIRHRLFNHGMSPVVATLVGVSINRVQKVAVNDSGSADVELLNDLFLKGFALDYAIPENLDWSHFIPDHVFAERGDERMEVCCRIH
jgi:hypothetical protein